MYLLGLRELAQIELVLEILDTPAITTLTAQLPPHFGEGVHRQPLLGALRPLGGPTGDPVLPVLPDNDPIVVDGFDVRAGATIHLDGARVAGTVRCVGGEFSPEFCSSERIEIDLDAPPTATGLYLIQLQNPGGPLSNELPICVRPVPECR